jgi:hypothetical protein
MEDDEPHLGARQNVVSLHVSLASDPAQRSGNLGV